MDKVITAIIVNNTTNAIANKSSIHNLITTQGVRFPIPNVLFWHSEDFTSLWLSVVL